MLKTLNELFPAVTVEQPENICFLYHLLLLVLARDAQDAGGVADLNLLCMLETHQTIGFKLF